MISLAILQRVALAISWSTKVLHHNITTITPEVQLANASYDSNSYFASYMSSHVGVASCNDTRYVISANTFVNAPRNTHHDYENYGQEPMSIVNSLSFDAISNIQHVNHYSSAIS